MKTRIRRVIISVSIIGVLLVSLLAPAVVYAQDQDPVIPSAFYGEVTVNGAEVPIFTVITGIIVDAAGSPGEGSIEVAEEGIYGSPPGDPGRLKVQTNSYDDVGKEIEFWVQLPGWANPVKADETSTYLEDVQELHLNVTLPPADLESLTEDLVADFVPAFDAGVYEYALAAAGDEAEVTLTATLESATITYSYGEVEDKEVTSGVSEVVPLEVGENVITISVALEGYESTISIITVTRAMPPVSATISPIEADYDLYAPGGVETIVTGNDAEEMVSVTYDGAPLTVDTDYTVTFIIIDETATLAILQSYIEGIDPAVAVDDALVFTIAFDVGEDATFTVNVIDTTPLSATIDPIEASYDLYAPADVTTTITWNDAAAVVSVEDAARALTTPDDYEVVGGTLTIKDAYLAYLAGKLTVVGDSVLLTITFDVGDPATFTITAIDTTPSAVETLLTLNDGWTLVSTDKWIDADSSAWEGDAVLVYRYTSEGYLEATFADLEPVEALYVKMPGGGQARLTYSDVVPGVSTKELVAGWNLISSATADDAAAVLSPLRYILIGEQQGVGLTTLVGQDNYNVSGLRLYEATITDANWDALALISLNPFDGYWVYMNAAKSFGVIPE